MGMSLVTVTPVEKATPVACRPVCSVLMHQSTVTKYARTNGTRYLAASRGGWRGFLGDRTAAQSSEWRVYQSHGLSRAGLGEARNIAAN